MLPSQEAIKAMTAGLSARDKKILKYHNGKASFHIGCAWVPCLLRYVYGTVLLIGEKLVGEQGFESFMHKFALQVLKDIDTVRK